VVDSNPFGIVKEQVLQVAIAVVIKETDVLLVHRHEGYKEMSWQFPAGIVKPGYLPDKVAVSETFSETGIHCSVQQNIGSRVHPTTAVHCSYFMCCYLAGLVSNDDPIENISVIWTPLKRLTSFVSRKNIYPPVIEALEKIDEEHEI
jgi:8-oxo-dGTP diphosphatase